MKIQNSTTYIPNLYAGFANIGTINVGNLTASTIIEGDKIPTTTVIGYSHKHPVPTMVTSSLLRFPGLLKASSSSDSNLLTIPDGANIIAIRYKGDNLVGPLSSAFDLGIDTFDGSVSNIPLVSGGTETIANTGAGGIVKISSDISGAPGIQVPPGSNFVILGMRNTPIDSGTLIVEIDYVL